MPSISFKWLFPGLGLLCLLSFSLALVSGSVPLNLPELWAALLDPNSEHRDLVMQLRLQRALAAWLTGALLALSGCLMQVLLRNPLADPYILGVSGGAACAALLSLSAGLAAVWLPFSAFGGALLSIFLVFALSRGTGPWSSTRLLLTGVVMAAGWGALISLILALSPDNSLRGMLYWLMGDLSLAAVPGWALLLFGVILLLALFKARSLNVLAIGESTATLLGENINRLVWLVYLMASLLTATAVAIAGSIGFIGLIVPHMMRHIIGSDHRHLLPASVLFGGAFLVFADTVARTIMAPNQLPVGVITALIGVPLFLVLLHSAKIRQ